jgi:hypothetical protein
MANSLLSAFRAIRLGGVNIGTNGDKLTVGAATTVMSTESGQFASAAGLSALDARLVQSGANLQSQINSLGGGAGVQLTGDQTVSGIKNFVTDLQKSGFSVIASNQTGQFASAAGLSVTNTNVTNVDTRVTNLSGTVVADYVAKASQVSIVTSMATGFDEYGILFGTTFGTIPKVQATEEVTGDVTYFCSVRNRSTTGYYVMFSDTIRESGVSVHTFASVS